MVKVPDEVREVFERQRSIPLATADLSGKPNVAMVGMWWWVDDGTLAVVDNYLNKTRSNIEENPRVSFVAYDGETRRSYQVKGSAEIVTSGGVFREGKRRADSRRRPGRAVVVVRVEEVYDSTAGEGAGKRIV